MVFNVFDFDKYTPEVLETLGEVLGKHGFSKNVVSSEYLAAKRAAENVQITVNRYSGLVKPFLVLTRLLIERFFLA